MDEYRLYNAAILLWTDYNKVCYIEQSIYNKTEWLLTLDLGMIRHEITEDPLLV